MPALEIVRRKNGKTAPTSFWAVTANISGSFSRAFCCISSAEVVEVWTSFFMVVFKPKHVLVDSSGPWVFLSIDGFCCVVREGSINYIILCERHEVEFTAEIRTIVLLCLASFFSLCLEGTYVVLKQDVLCSAPG